MELLARILSRQPNKPKAESTLLDEKIPQQQVQCAAIKALLQLSPLLAEEASPGQAASEVLINVLLPGDDVSAPGRTDQLNATEAELRQLCLLALSNLSAQPQSLTSLLSLSPPLGGAGSSAIAAGPSHLYSQLGHALWSRLDDLFLTGWQHKQVLLQGYSEIFSPGTGVEASSK